MNSSFSFLDPMKLASFVLAAAFFCTQPPAYALPVSDWRADELDAAFGKLAAEPNAELRKLAEALADDAASVHDEDKELREIWLTMGRGF